MMKDFFALLGQPRRPWLLPEQLKQSFLQAAARCHPDRMHAASEEVRREAHQRYTCLNEAHLCLTEPRCRLRHLLELERGCKVPDLQEIPDDLMQFFALLIRQFKETDDFLKARDANTSPLLKVALFEQGESLREMLQQTLDSLRRKTEDLLERVRDLDGRWEDRSGTPERRECLLADLENLYRLLSFHDRWHHQTQTRTLQLME
jgi:DnaJ-domain-containing protein 1